MRSGIFAAFPIAASDKPIVRPKGDYYPRIHVLGGHTQDQATWTVLLTKPVEHYLAQLVCCRACWWTRLLTRQVVSRRVRDVGAAIGLAGDIGVHMNHHHVMVLEHNR